MLRSDQALGRRQKDKRTKQSREQGHTWRDRLRAGATAGGPAAAIIKEYLLADLVQRLAKKRFVRAITTMVPKVAGILGDILTLTGVGAIGGTAAKAFGTAWELGQTGLRWLKQKVHDRKPEHHKSTASKQREYIAASDTIFDQYAALAAHLPPQGDPATLDLHKASVEVYVKAAGARPGDLYRAKDIPEAYRLLIKAMKDR